MLSPAILAHIYPSTYITGFKALKKASDTFQVTETLSMARIKSPTILENDHCRIRRMKGDI
jgi:hypothetical protein